MSNLYNCDFCMYQEGCIGELPGPNGRCMGFCVPAEKSVLYRKFVAESFTDDFLNNVFYFVDFVPDGWEIRRRIQEHLPVLLDKYHMFFMGFLSADEEVPSDGQ